MKARPQRYRAGFTLVELLVVLALITILISLLLPAVGKAKVSAKRTHTASALRQLLAGYVMYHQDNKGSLLHGYTPSVIGGVAVLATSRSGHTFSSPVSDRYPWRIAPYVQDVWGVIHTHAEVPPVPRPGDSDADAGSKAYILSVQPSFGINSVYLGGHHGQFAGFAGPDNTPNVGQHVAFKFNEVRRPSELIVFAEAKIRNYPGAAADTGISFLTPPRARGHRWRVRGGKFEILSGQIVGLPESRNGAATITGFLDGHVDALTPDELQDMRRWAPRAASPDYDYVK